jgi:hypothetical protein
MSVENVKTLAQVLKERGIEFPAGLQGRVAAVGPCHKYGGGDEERGCDGEIRPLGRDVGVSCGHVGRHRGTTTCLADDLQANPKVFERILKPRGTGG